MLALIGNFDFTELLVIAVVALMAFGRNLPQVAMRAAVQLARARRALTAMWREAGLEDELRRVRREVERETNLPKLQSPQKMVRDAGRRYMDDIEGQIESSGTGDPEPRSQAPSPEPPAEATQARGEVGAAPSPGPAPSPGQVDLTPRPVQRDTTPQDDRREDASPGAAPTGDPPAGDGDRETA